MTYRGRKDAYKNSRVDPYSILADHERYEPLREALMETGESDEYYVNKMQDLFSTSLYYGVPPTPTMIAPNVFLGTQANGENLDLLKRMKITHVLYCAGLPTSLRHARGRRFEGTNITYDELAMDDNEDFNVTGFFGHAHAFIEAGRMRRGKVLIHCTGVSRSGVVALAYLIRTGKKLLASCQVLKEDRRVVLCNFGFMKQLVQYARGVNALDPEPQRMRIAEYGRKLDRARILQAHMPDYLSGK